MRSRIGVEYRTLIHYFLGELAEREQEAVEERYMVDEAYAELRDQVEIDLVDAYVGGTLTPLERRHFEQHYLVTRERQEGVKAGYLSRVYRERIARPAVPAHSTPLIPFFRGWSMAPAMAAAITVLAIGGAGWLIYEWWGIRRQVSGVVQMAANRPVRPPGVLRGNDGKTATPGVGREPTTVPAPTHRQATGASVSAPQSTVRATLPEAPTITSQSPIIPRTGHPATTTSHPAPIRPEAPSATPLPAEAVSPSIEAPPPRPNPVEVPEVQNIKQMAVRTTTPPTTAYPVDRTAAAIQETLESEYQTTKTTDDKSDIVTAGYVMVLHKDKVLLVAATVFMQGLAVRQPPNLWYPNSVTKRDKDKEQPLAHGTDDAGQRRAARRRD